jgi:hypothetical protein
MLRRLLLKGMGDLEIARAMGITQKMVIGKRQRLHLPANRSREKRGPKRMPQPQAWGVVQHG